VRVRVKDELCVGHSMCWLACPEIFHLSDEDGHAYVLHEDVLEAHEAAVRQAEQSCPEQAIEIF
jgi:ferredoxin